MNSVMKKGVMVLVAGATVATVAAPAEAQRYRRYHRGGNDAAIAIGAGIIGLGVGAAIASSNRDRYYDPYYGRGYYDRGYYGRGYYDRGYYGRGYYPRCYTRRVYDPYIGRRVRVRYCD